MDAVKEMADVSSVSSSSERMTRANARNVSYWDSFTAAITLINTQVIHQLDCELTEISPTGFQHHTHGVAADRHDQAGVPGDHEALAQQARRGVRAVPTPNQTHRARPSYLQRRGQRRAEVSVTSVHRRWTRRVRGCGTVTAEIRFSGVRSPRFWVAVTAQNGEF